MRPEKKRLFALLLSLAIAVTGCSGKNEPTTESASDSPPLVDEQAGDVSSMPVPAPPELAARSYILVDAQSGSVLAQSEADSRQEPASLTKLMTAYGVFLALNEGRIKLEDMVTISEKAWKQEGSRMFVEVGNQVSVENLIRGMIVQSGNDATVALAEHIAGSEEAFVQMMNAYAEQLGMTGTHFTNAAGMPDPEHYMTARDTATLAIAMINKFPDYYRWYSEKEFTWNGITQQNRNGLLWRDPTVDGVKTGHTESAGYCLVTSAKRDGMRLVSVVMGTDSMKARESASAALLNYGFNFFETKRLYAASEPLATARVWKGRQKEIGLVLKDDLLVTVPRGTTGRVSADFELPEHIVAPLSVDTPIGSAKIVVDGETVATYDLYPADNVPAGGWIGRMIDSVRMSLN
jgi:D-alanyl-D-alanine carboxypeptidase (penicillin-binding protein 5/6)